MVPMRPLTPAGQRIVEAAEELFYDRGITAVGVDLVAERSGVTKRTLYNQFGSKDALVATYLETRNRRWQTQVEEEVAKSKDVEAAVTAPFVALEEWTRASTRGCAFINALAELPDPEHPAHRVAADQKRWLHDLFERLATSAGCAEPAELALRLLLLHEGVLATQPLALDTARASTDLARQLTRASLAGPRA